MAGLNKKQEDFCEHYARTGNGSESYKLAYSTGLKSLKDSTCRTNASKLLTQPNISARVSEIKAELYEERKAIEREELLTKHDLLKVYRSIIEDPDSTRKEIMEAMRDYTKLLGYNEPEKIEQTNTNEYILEGFGDIEVEPGEDRGGLRL